jgi:enoyl-CoA hydratase/carnithine racemase
MSETSGHILSEISDGICTVTFNRPERKNALTVAMYEDLVRILSAAEQDPAVRVIVFTGTGNIYTSGNDVADFMNTPPAGPDSPVFKLLTFLVDSEKPLLAAVNGAAVGVGVTMLLHCDLAYAAEEAKFQMPFVNLGLVPEGASSLLLPLLAGHHKAAELLMFSDRFDAATALSAGIVNQVFPADQLLDAVRARAKALAAKPSVSVKLTKKLLKHGLRAQIHETLLREGADFIERLSSPAAIEAFTAFFEKRAPDFRSVGE